RSYTTGHRAFAVCQRHTAKAGLHSAKCLPCVTHGKPPTAYNGWQSDYLPCVGSRAHGKGFAVCHVGTRQTFSEKNKKKSGPPPPPARPLLPPCPPPHL